MSRALVNATNPNEAEIFLYDYIGGDGLRASDFIAQLKTVTAPRLTLRINSPGGEVFQGWAIYNALQQNPAKIIAKIDGIAASMASVIAMAGDEIQMAANAMMMVHNPSGATTGESDEMRRAADLLDKVKQGIVAAYVRKTALSAKEVSALMDAETWLSAEEAKAKGFCDTITDSNAVANSLAQKFDLSRFAKAPQIKATVVQDRRIAHQLVIDRRAAEFKAERDPKKRAEKWEALKATWKEADRIARDPFQRA